MNTRWKSELLGDVATLQRGFDLPHRLRKTGTVPIVTSSGTEATHSEARVKAPGVVTGRYGTIGEVFFVREDFWPLNTTLYVRDFHGNDPLFVSYLLRTIDFHTHSGKSGVPGVNRNDLHEIVVGLPPTKAEQEAIAEALSDTDALIESLEQLVAKKHHLKQGTMQELLTGKKRLPGFQVKSGLKKSKLGLIPEDWLCDGIGGFIDLLTGFPFSSGGYSHSGIRLLRGSNVKRGCTDWADNLAAFWPSVTAELRKYLLKPGDIVVAMDGSLVGRSFASLGTYDLPALLLQRVARIRSENISQAYLKAWICSQRFTTHCDLVKTTTAIPHISPADIRCFVIAIPPTKIEQEAIATILSDIDAEIAELETQLTKTRDLKQGMMHKLLTGEIRLL